MREKPSRQPHTSCGENVIAAVTLFYQTFQLFSGQWKKKKGFVFQNQITKTFLLSRDWVIFSQGDRISGQLLSLVSALC